MLSFLFLTCCFLIIIACSEGAVTDAKKLETRQTCSTNDFSSGCTLSNFSFSTPSTSGSSTDSQLNSLNQHYSRNAQKLVLVLSQSIIVATIAGTNKNI